MEWLAPVDVELAPKYIKIIIIIIINEGNLSLPLTL
jgi:hypothetical protein